MDERTQIVIAYDGSPAARAAVREAALLFASHRVVILTVWEAGLEELMLVPDPAGIGSTMLPFDPGAVEAVQHASEDRAGEIAKDGVALASSVGLDAEGVRMRDVTDLPSAISSFADEREALVIVVGSHGLRGLKSKLLGSTSTGLLKRTSRPVLVVSHPEDEGNR
jgi:nucleotide-binding universal stress UspA family protein